MQLICCDLDGTLTPVNTVAVSTVIALRQYPQLAPAVAGLALINQARMKQLIARTVAVDPSGIPYHQPVLDYLRAQRKNGAHLILATATDYTIAARVADYLDLFDDVIASDGKLNCRARNKRNAIQKRYPATPFTYLGDSFADRAVWRASAHPILVSPTGLVPWWAKDIRFEKIITTAPSNRPRNSA